MSDTTNKDSITGEIKKGVDDLRDSAGEVMHRSAADAEKTKRDVAGDDMTTREKIASGASEAKERIEAEADKAKREIRDKT
ncbi:MAG TPA: hypothetical protein VGN11_09820 [Candidatus Baltobacteraceae bacterium]|jgi:ElaB/YqjD/DUF883 family membrane-anchored ribosome-binding protein|nr:hypothetical protein [Candidatus Baltobacteraceae bacterium]